MIRLRHPNLTQNPPGVGPALGFTFFPVISSQAAGHGRHEPILEQIFLELIKPRLTQKVKNYQIMQDTQQVNLQQAEGSEH